VRVVVLGAGGQLASDLERVMQGWDLILLRHADLDICDHARARQALTRAAPEVVINTAAFHRVDDCEDQPEKAFRVNAIAVRNLAQVCRDLSCVLAHISTDYVFDGHKREPYNEDDLPIPLSVYGASKLAGESFVRSIAPGNLVIRTSGLYGEAGSSGKGGNFVETMISLAKSGEPIRVVDDQVFSPTYTKDLAVKMRELLESEAHGLFHITNQGQCTWFAFASRVFELVGLKPDLSPTSSEAFGAKAARPAYSVLANERLRTQRSSLPRDWQYALTDYLSWRMKIADPANRRGLSS